MSGTIREGGPLADLAKVDAYPAPWDESEWRLDAFHALMKWSKYGKKAKYGWEVDRIAPASRGGGDNMGNLRPMHWMNAGAKYDR